MFLVQILLPIVDHDGGPYPRADFDAVRHELTAQFGGATAFLRAPAEGTWVDPAGDVQGDRVVVVEVMVEALDRGWWRRYREGLERRFRQDEIVVRASEITRL